MMFKVPLPLLFSLLFSTIAAISSAQMITGVWKGKINRQKVEVKIIRNGDSLTGTAYYYESATNYRRYSIKGFFDPATNEAVWWDDRLLDEKSGRFSISTPGKMPLLSRADFNCPGGSRMMLDGKAADKEDLDDIKGEVHLDKAENPFFKDEWDYIIENYLVGGNDPELIKATEQPVEEPVTLVTPIPAIPTAQADKPAPVVIAEKKTDPVAVIENKPVEQKKEITPVVPTPPKPQPPAIEEKFKAREKKFIKEIPVSGDSIELRFYDNAEIDGDSISLFLNDRLIFQHIKLTANPYIIKLALHEMNATNELVMVAENMGAIPPNTSYMVAMVGDKRHDAYLSSTEGSSAMIRLQKIIQ
jgi:hypothetical protein